MTIPHAALDPWRSPEDREKIRTTDPTIVLWYNPSAGNGPCPICGERNDPEIGLELFPVWDGTLVLTPLCDTCGQRLAPELAQYRGVKPPDYVNPGRRYTTDDLPELVVYAAMQGR